MPLTNRTALRSFLLFMLNGVIIAVAVAATLKADRAAYRRAAAGRGRPAGPA